MTEISIKGMCCFNAKIKELCQHAWTCQHAWKRKHKLCFQLLACFLVQRLETPLIRRTANPPVGQIPLHVRLRNILFRDILKYGFPKERKNLATKTRKCSNALVIFLAALRDEFLKTFSPTRKERAELIAS